jgi:hypothetical protein
MPTCFGGCCTKSCPTWCRNCCPKLGVALCCASVKARAPTALTASFWLIWVTLVLSFPPATFAGLPSGVVTRVLTSLSAPRNAPALSLPLPNVTLIVVVTVTVFPSASLVLVCCEKLATVVFCANSRTKHGRVFLYCLNVLRFRVVLLSASSPKHHKCDKQNAEYCPEESGRFPDAVIQRYGQRCQATTRNDHR